MIRANDFAFSAKRSKFVFNETDGRFAGFLWPDL